MSLMLGADQVTLFSPPAGADEHGWTLPATAQVWQGSGNLQRLPGRSDPLMREGGGQGPFGPNVVDTAMLYLPSDAPVSEGMVAEVRGERYVLSQVHPVLDPTGTGGLDCLVASAARDTVWGLDG